MSKTTTPPPQKAASKRQAKPKRPAHLPHGRWLGDLEAERPLSAAEKALVAACALGRGWTPMGWDGKRPEAATAANTIRADLIRFLLLGGDAEHPVHEEGVILGGAWIDDTLNLHQAQAVVRLAAHSCHFLEIPNFIMARLAELSLSGCFCPGLYASELEVTGSVFLSDDFHAKSGVHLLGAEIGGNLICSGGVFENVDDIAIHADGVTVKGSVNLRDGFHATGEVRLLGAEIAGSLDCSGGRFENVDGIALHADGVTVKGSVNLRDGFHATGEVRLLGTEIASSLDCSDGRFENADGAALCTDGITVNGALFLRGVKVQGMIDLTGGRVGALIDGDDLSCWQGGRQSLNGFRYDRIIGCTDAMQRIAWLNLQVEDELIDDFYPQPWEQLIKVLREMGHPDAASEVAIAKQEQMRTAGVVKGRWRRALHWLYGQLAGYGHRPLLTVRAMVIVWLLCGFAFWAAADKFAAIGPANPVVTSATLYPDGDTKCGHGNELGKKGHTGKARWTECPGVPDEYSTFQPFVYSLDLILPLVDLQQDSDWAPIAEGPTGDDLLPGMLARWLMWFEILFGWAMSLMLVAVLGRLVDKD